MSVLLKSNELKYLVLKNLEDMIAERKSYLKEQEALITDLIDSGNTELMGLHHEIFISRQVLRDLKTDLRTGIQDKVLLNEDLKTIRSEIDVLVVYPSF